MKIIDDFIGKRFVSKKQGLEYEVVSFEYRDVCYRSILYFKIRFIISGFETIQRKYDIEHGSVFDWKYKEMTKDYSMDVDDIVGNVYTSFSQKLEYEVVEYTGHVNYKPTYKIRFIKSGNERVYDRHHVLYGEVSDNTIKRTLDTSNIIGNIYSNRKGLEYKVLEKSNIPGRYIVKFLKSGNVRDNCLRATITRGLIGDK